LTPDLRKRKISPFEFQSSFIPKRLNRYFKPVVVILCVKSEIQMQKQKKKKKNLPDFSEKSFIRGHFTEKNSRWIIFHSAVILSDSKSFLSRLLTLIV
jgi:hypothetical protein